MAVQTPPVTLPFGGVWTKGSALDRPIASSVRCRNFRIMPPAVAGGKPYLRLRGGRKIVYTGSAGSFLQFYDFRKVAQTGAVYNICLHFDGSATKWKQIVPGYSLSDITTITGASGSGPSTLVGVRNKLFMYNGLGARSTDSKPPFSSWDGTTVRYVGLDAFCPSGTPTATFTPGAGNNTIISFVSIYAALFNSTTQHVSNGIFCGTLSTPGTGTISVANLDKIVPTYNNATEHAELFYVFFATIDGGQTAYQVLNSALTGPFTVAVTSTSANLSLSTLTPAGFVLDLTQERPIENYPPRPMSQIAYANGRVYGVLNGTGTGSAVVLPDSGGNFYKDFTYALTVNDVGALCWSSAADDSTQTDFVGVPEESWPIRNRKFTPNSEMPLIIDASPGGNQLLVVTTNGTFLLYEAADGLHQWVTLSDHDGTQGPQTYVRTPRGPMWLTQKHQLVLLDSRTGQLEKLSEGFDELLNSPLSYGPTGVCADYLWDPHSLIDRYEVWRSDGSSVIYDFAIGGMAYESTGPAISAARTVLAADGTRTHFMGGLNLYVQESDPALGVIPTRDMLAVGVYTEINGDYISQWLNLGDARDRKRLTDMDIVGDGAPSSELGASPLTFTYYVDLTNTANTPALVKSGQCTTDNNYKARVHTANPFWVKFRVQLAGHGGDGVPNYPEASSYDGELVPNVYGSVFEIAPTENFTGNRP